MKLSGCYNQTNPYNRLHTVTTTGLTIILFAAVMLTSSSAQSSSDLFIHVLDIGQGDAMILHQPDSCAVLIDAGPLINGHRVTEKVTKLGLSSLDMVIVSHPHIDHFGGLFDLLPRIPARQFFDNGLPNKAWEYFDDYKMLRKDQPYKEIARGDLLECGSIKINVLHPEPHPNPEDLLNNTSLALMISFGDFRLLHMGDVAGKGAKRLLASAQDINADVIKIAHHGAIDSASEELLKQTSPDLALISTAAVNRIGSPAPEAIARLDNLNIPYLRTDHSGDIEISISEGSYRVQTANSR